MVLVDPSGADFNIVLNELKNVQLSPSQILSSGSLYQRGWMIKVSDDGKVIDIYIDHLGIQPVYYDNEAIYTSFELFEIDNYYPNLNSYIMKLVGYMPGRITLSPRIRRLLPCEYLHICVDSGTFEIKERPKRDFLKNSLGPLQVIQTILSEIPPDHDVLIPLSSGHDSRILLSEARKVLSPEKITCFTYSLLPKGYCYESKAAMTLCHHLGVDWHSISISGFSDFDQLDRRYYGLSSQLDAGYSILASKALSALELNPRTTTIISGLLGDVYSGKYPRSSFATMNNSLYNLKRIFPAALYDANEHSMRGLAHSLIESDINLMSRNGYSNWK